MSNVNETLERIKSLYNYGREINEDNNRQSTGILEYHEKAADGKAYGIIRECNKYYIKTAPANKENIAEAYDYIGGFCNKKDYEYTSYANASKHFGLKMASINEACEGKVIVENLNPFANNNQIMTEASQGMKDELARQRQIMYNAAMIMNESSIPTPAISRRDDTVMYNGKNPEAETGKTGAKPEGATEGKATLDKDFKTKTNGVDKKVAPFDQNASASKDQLKEGEECGCESGNCKKEKFGCDWGSEGIGKGKDPHTIGWNMEGQQAVNEEENDWGSEGLPSSPGVGDANTSKNNDPFNKSVNESDEFDNTDVEGDDVNTDVAPEAGDDNEVDMGVDDDVEGDDSTADPEIGPEGDDFGDEGTDDLGDDELGDGTDNFDSNEVSDDEFTGDGEDDLQAEIDRLQAELDDLKAQVEGGNIDDDDDLTSDEFNADTDDLGDEGTDDFGGDNTDFDDTEAGAEGTDDEFGNGTEGLGDDDEFGAQPSMSQTDSDDFDASENFDDDMDECGNGGCGMIPRINESKKRKMDAIVESVVKSLLKEDELHDFGNHPGYQKKPMQLPTTGEDKNQWGRDWNDESVHNEQPFGTKIGSSAPFDKIVDAVTKDVMAKLKEMGDGEKKN